MTGGSRRIIAKLRGKLSRAPRLTRTTGSLSRRMTVIASVWITLLLAVGGIALDRVLSDTITRGFDRNLDYVLLAMIRSSEIGTDGEVRLLERIGDQRFLEPYSGLYWQISGTGQEPYPSRSLWDRTLATDRAPGEREIVRYFSRQFPEEELRVVERDVVLPGASTVWRYQVAQSRAALDDQIADVRRTLIPSFVVTGLGLVILSALQTIYGLWPLRDLRRAIARLRSGTPDRLDMAFPAEVSPLVDELNALIAHNERQAEEARLHAGNLAHALKTPLTVITAAADAGAGDLADTVLREAQTMRRQVDHHLARARAVGRRGAAQVRACLGDSLAGVTRAIERLYPAVRLDHAGDTTLCVRLERQDLDELLGNLIDNAAKYGGGSVFVTLDRDGEFARILVEDDGPGIAEEMRARIFDRGVRLDSGQPGTGLGLAIVRDVAEIYGGSVSLSDSEDLGGLAVLLRLPAAP